MISKALFIPTLVGSNYLSWKIKMIDMLRCNILWRLTIGDLTKPIDAKELVIWEYRCDQVKDTLDKLFQIDYMYTLKLKIEY